MPTAVEAEVPMKPTSPQTKKAKFPAVFLAIVFIASAPELTARSSATEIRNARLQRTALGVRNQLTSIIEVRMS